MSEVENVNVAGPSTAETEDTESLYNEINKRRLKDATVYYQNLLEQNGLIASQPSAEISEESMVLGEDIFEYTLETLAEKKFVTFNELIMFNEIDEENAFEEVGGNNSSDDDDYEPEEKKAKSYKDYIPLDYKVKVINIARAHPNWTLKSLQSKGCHRLKRKEDLLIWEQHVKSGGTTVDKYGIIDSWTYDRFTEARENNHQVTSRNLQQWALSAASQFDNFDFKASNAWMKRFKKKHKIRQRKITKFVGDEEIATTEQILASAETFRIQVRDVIPNFKLNYVINTDQTGCQYQSTFDRTLATKGSKTDLVKWRNINKVTHSYTAQYAISLSGELLPHVFICLQEATGSFGPRVQKSVDEYLQKYQNVVVTSSKSGKLTRQLYKDFLINVLKPYVGVEIFLLLLDSWSGQTDATMYNEIFQNEKRLPTCTLKIIPPKCTPLVQPCDVYFYRQVKNFIKRLQNCSYLIEREREINSREDCIKIHSIVHHQLSAPVFDSMLQYAWYASKLCDNRNIFRNVNEVCFPIDISKMPCTCKSSAFVQCARCRKTFCFPCFYDEYHPGSCETPLQKSKGAVADVNVQ